MAAILKFVAANAGIILSIASEVISFFSRKEKKECDHDKKSK
jgi:hypothetical protein